MKYFISQVKLYKINSWYKKNYVWDIIHVNPQITAKFYDFLKINYYGIRFLSLRRTWTSRWFLNWWSLVLIILCLSIELHQHHVRMVMVTISWHILAVLLRYKKIPGVSSQFLILSRFGSKISLSLIISRVPGRLRRCCSINIYTLTRHAEAVVDLIFVWMARCWVVWRKWAVLVCPINWENGSMQFELIICSLGSFRNLVKFFGISLTLPTLCNLSVCQFV